MIKRTVLVILFVTTFVFCVHAEETLGIFSVIGDAKLVRRNTNIGIDCKNGMSVYAGDWIKTGPESKITLSIDEGFENGF